MYVIVKTYVPLLITFVFFNKINCEVFGIPNQDQQQLYQISECVVRCINNNNRAHNISTLGPNGVRGGTFFYLPNNYHVRTYLFCMNLFLSSSKEKLLSLNPLQDPSDPAITEDCYTDCAEKVENLQENKQKYLLKEHAHLELICVETWKIVLTVLKNDSNHSNNFTTLDTKNQKSLYMFKVQEDDEATNETHICLVRLSFGSFFCF